MAKGAGGMEKLAIKDFYHGKKVFITGNTGFKGSWLAEVLMGFGAEVLGYALKPPTDPALFYILRQDERFPTIFADVRNLSKITKAVKEFRPDIVIHMAAQPIVLMAYENPTETYEINVMGTVNILEAVRQVDTVQSFLNVTTDKVYRNNEWAWGYRETDVLDGFDPYSNSKSCAELVTRSFRDSFFAKEAAARISTARAGNVIGGGDFAANRIIPDCVRAAHKKERIVLRNPQSVRPYQHVLEPVFAYLTIAKAQYEDRDFAGSYNVGPNEEDCVTTAQLAELFCNAWGNGLAWQNTDTANGPHEANFLRLDSSLIKQKLEYAPRWDIKKGVSRSIDIYKAYFSGDDVNVHVERQIKEFIKDGK